MMWLLARRRRTELNQAACSLLAWKLHASTYGGPDSMALTSVRILVAGSRFFFIRDGTWPPWHMVAATVVMWHQSMRTSPCAWFNGQRLSIAKQGACTSPTAPGPRSALPSQEHLAPGSFTRLFARRQTQAVHKARELLQTHPACFSLARLDPWLSSRTAASCWTSWAPSTERRVSSGGGGGARHIPFGSPCAAAPCVCAPGRGPAQS